MNSYPKFSLSPNVCLRFILRVCILTFLFSQITAASKNVLFTLFNGESFDYLGSNRVVYDMTSSNSSSSWPVADAKGSSFVPIQMEDLSHFIELSQVRYKFGITVTNCASLLYFSRKKEKFLCTTVFVY